MIRQTSGRSSDSPDHKQRDEVVRRAEESAERNEDWRNHLVRRAEQSWEHDEDWHKRVVRDSETGPRAIQSGATPRQGDTASKASNPAESFHINLRVDVVPPRLYLVRVVECSDWISQKGNACLRVGLAIEGDSEYAGHLLTDFVVREGRGRYRLNQMLVAVGLEPTSVARYKFDEVGELVDPALLGRPARAVIEQEEWRGQLRNKIERYLPARPLV